MPEFDKERFKEYWGRTEVIREYQRMLYTFGDMELPYVFVAEHSRFKNRTVVKKGVVLIQKLRILLPGYSSGPEFREGFEHANAIPPEAVYLFRTMGLPYSHITNKPVAEEELEYGSLRRVLDRLKREMEDQENTETGLMLINQSQFSTSICKCTASPIISTQLTSPTLVHSCDLDGDGDNDVLLGS